MKLLLLDMDDTVREPINGDKFISKPDDQKLIDGALEAIQAYHDMGWTIVGITNQGVLQRGTRRWRRRLQSSASP